MSHRPHLTFLDLEHTVILLDQTFEEVSAEEAEQAHCCFNPIRIVIKKPRVEALPDTPYERPASHQIQDAHRGPVPFPSVQDLREEANLRS